MTSPTEPIRVPLIGARLLRVLRQRIQLLTEELQREKRPGDFGWNRQEIGALQWAVDTLSAPVVQRVIGKQRHNFQRRPRCRDCNEPIEFVLMVGTGAPMPVDAQKQQAWVEAAPDGAPGTMVQLVVETDRGGKLRRGIMVPDGLGELIEGYVPHWGTCSARNKEKGGDKDSGPTAAGNDSDRGGGLSRGDPLGRDTG